MGALWVLKSTPFGLWWRENTAGVLLVPLVSEVTPPAVSEGGLPVPSRPFARAAGKRPAARVNLAILPAKMKS